MIWRFLAKSKTELSYYSATVLLDIYPNNTKTVIKRGHIHPNEPNGLTDMSTFHPKAAGNTFFLNIFQRRSLSTVTFFMSKEYLPTILLRKGFAH